MGLIKMQASRHPLSKAARSHRIVINTYKDHLQLSRTQCANNPPLIKDTLTEANECYSLAKRSSPNSKSLIQAYATILYFDNLDVPNCPICNSSDAARVSVGVVGRSMRVDLARSEFKLLDNRSCRGRHYCNACERFFD